MLENGLGVPERLTMCRELLEAHIRLEHVKGKTNATVLVKHRAAAIRRALLGSGAGGVDLADELLSPARAGARLNSIIDGLEGKPELERVRTALYVKGLAEVLSTLMKADAREGSMIGATDFQGVAGRAKQILGEDRAVNDHVIDAGIGVGKFGDDIRDELVTASNAGAAYEKAKQADFDVANKRLEDVQAQDQAFRARYRELLRIADGETRAARINELYAEWDVFRAKLLTPAEDEIRVFQDGYRNAERDARAAVGRKMIARIMDASPVTQEQAEAWAAAQEITPQAKARLRKIGYPVEDVRRDMAEFYRFTSGRLPGARIHSNGDKRANATDIEAHGKVGTINLGTGFDKKTLWHELGHHLEADPVAKAAAGRFIRRRSVDGKAYSLRSLTGIKGYRRDEAAVQGNFFDPYVGKIYNDGATEVFSMGVETFSDPVLLSKRAMDDPQTLEFVGGFLAAPLDDLGRAHARLRDMLREATDDAEGQREANAAEMVKQIAEGVTLVKSDDRSWMGQYDWMYASDKVLGYIDQPSGARYWVLQSKVRESWNSRKVTGFRVINPHDGGMNQHTFASKDIDLLKVAMVKFEKFGMFPTASSLAHESNLKDALP